MNETEEQAAREEIVRLAKALDAAGMMPSKSGNLSRCLGDGLLITPAGLPYAEMRPADLVLIGPDGQVRSGNGRPSSEWRLHLAICHARPDIRAVVHTHSPKATALACARRGIPPFHYMIALAGGDIRCGDYATYGTIKLADAAVRALAGRRAALLANHGVVAVGTSLGAAYTLAVEVENLARAYLALLAARLEPVLLSEAELAEVAARFGDHGRSG